VNLRLMKDRSFAMGMLFNFILGFGLFGSVFVIPVFAQSFLGFTATDTGKLLIPGSIATAIMMPFIGKALQKKLPANLFSGIGFFLFYFFTYMLSTWARRPEPRVFSGPWWSAAWALDSSSSLDHHVAGGTQGQGHPQGTGLTNMIRQLGGSFGVAVMATFIERRTTFHQSILLRRDHIVFHGGVSTPVRDDRRLDGEGSGRRHRQGAGAGDAGPSGREAGLVAGLPGHFLFRGILFPGLHSAAVPVQSEQGEDRRPRREFHGE